MYSRRLECKTKHSPRWDREQRHNIHQLHERHPRVQNSFTTPTRTIQWDTKSTSSRLFHHWHRASMSSSLPRQATSISDKGPVSANGSSIFPTRRLFSSRRIALNATAVFSFIRNLNQLSVWLLERGVRDKFREREGKKTIKSSLKRPRRWHPVHTIHASEVQLTWLRLYRCAVGVTEEGEGSNFLVVSKFYVEISVGKRRINPLSIQVPCRPRGS